MLITAEKEAFMLWDPAPKSMNIYNQIRVDYEGVAVDSIREKDL